MRPPSPHLSWSELACRDGTPYPRAWRAARLPLLVSSFEVIRRQCGGRPIRVTSAYRTPAHNRRIGGARRSQHLAGRALDLAPPAGLTVAQFWRRIRTLVTTEALPWVSGLGRYRTFVHIDTRPSTRLVVWRGAGVKDDTVRA